MNIKPISVTELNLYIKDKINEDEFLSNVYVKGEISNFKHHYTGHMYFTLKDEKSLIKCIMFKSSTERLNFTPKDGMKVRAFGTVAVFERDGVYQIYCKAMEEDGLGDLYQKYEELKNKLEKRGLFDQIHKKRIPFMPKVIGVLTSSTGAVIRDIINVSTRRNPNVYIRLLPVPVQGNGAENEIARAIKVMNENNLADVIILARGGGSLEDLWPFNEEIVAEAIYNSNIPIISAVGHETDFTIADFVADLRAPTPSAAAELAVKDIRDINEKLMNYNKRYKLALNKKVEFMKLRHEKVMNRRAYTNPLQRIQDEYVRLDKVMKNIEISIIKKEKELRVKTIELITKIDSLSPLKILTRGYVVAENKGNIVKSVNDIKVNDEIHIILSDGKAVANIEEILENK